METGIVKYWGLRFITGTLVYLLGGWDNLLRVMVTLIIVDYITGLLKAMYNQRLASIKGYKGLIKKAGYLLAIIVAVCLDDLLKEVHLAIPLIISGVPLTFRQLIIIAIIGNEGISIVENLGELGCPMPKFFKNFFKKLKEIDKEQE